MVVCMASESERAVVGGEKKARRFAMAADSGEGTDSGSEPPELFGTHWVRKRVLRLALARGTLAGEAP